MSYTSASVEGAGAERKHAVTPGILKDAHLSERSIMPRAASAGESVR